MNPRLLRILIMASTVVLAWAGLTLGNEQGETSLSPGDRAEREYRAQSSADVPDEELTEELRDQAEAEVEPATRRDEDAEQRVFEDVDGLLTSVRQGVPASPDESGEETPATTTTSTTSTTSTTVPDTTDTTEAGEAEDDTTTTTIAEQAVLEGFLFVDVTGNGLFEDEAPEDQQWTPDAGLANVRVEVTIPNGETLSTESLSDGTVNLPVPEGQLEVSIDTTDPDFPANFVPSVGSLEQTVECSQGDCQMEPVGITPDARPIAEQVEDLEAEYGNLIPVPSLETLATLATQDLVRRAKGVSEENLALNTVQLNINEEVTDLFRDGVTAENLSDVRGRVRSDPPFFNIDGRRNDDARQAVGDVIAAFLVANRVPDPAATQARIEEARAAVPTQTRTVEAGDLIAAPGERLTQFQIAAIELTRADTGRVIREGALIVLLGVLVATLGFYLARFRPQFWNRPRMVALWGLLVVLGAGAVRLTFELSERTGWYILPAVAFGYLAAVLFDNRMGTLMALTMGVLTAAGIQEPGATVYAVLATLAPIGFVSKVSSRRAFRNSVVISAVAGAVVAGAIAWFFETSLSETPLADVGIATAWALGASLVASLVALAAMPFFESMFDVTTTLRLLELTDRNHEALQTLQEQAFGTFNHSLMVGTLADGAARAIGANNLLVRAAAYYHDLGKTENPLYFIENQFGVPNPHDELPPEESARIIRQHVLDGVRLAKRYKIPSEVAEGIVCHHGDAIMRFFYEKARAEHGDDIDPDDFRHAGYKPTSKEMAILMLADSVEGACRAVFGEEEPTPDAISKVVNRVVDEKVGDGQLSESALTLGELSRVRQAFIEALVGHYHQRIPYPNFPGI